MANKTLIFADNKNIIVRNETLTTYLREASKVKPLSTEKMAEVAEMAQQGDSKARELLIRSNLKMVVSIAKHYMGLGLEMEDLIQAGNIGLCKAVESYNAEKGKFTTCALMEIRDSIREEITHFGKMVYLTRIQREQGVESSHVSADAPIGNDEDGSEVSFIDMMVSESRADNLIAEHIMRERVTELMAGLKPIERKILCGLFGIGETEKTQYELSLIYRYTEERIRQIKHEAIAKMQKFAGV